MAADPSPPRGMRPFLIFGTLVVVTAGLYFARAILIPIVLGILLTFILTPLVLFLQRRGLGRSVLAEGLRRMAARGMRRAEVSAYSDNAAALGLYKSVGFERDGDLLTYVKPVTAL